MYVGNTVEHDTMRFDMWCSLISGYGHMTRNQKKKAKWNYAVDNGCTPNDVCWNADLDCCKQAIPAYKDVPCINPKENEKEHTMGYYDKTATDLEIDQRKHLKSRLNDIFYSLSNAIGKKFNLTEPDGPQTKDDLLTALKNGQFTLKDDYFDKNGTLYDFHDVNNAISWRTTPFDRIGYDAAVTALSKAHQDAKDKITILPVVDGLAALQAFEAYTV